MTLLSADFFSVRFVCLPSSLLFVVGNVHGALQPEGGR